MKFTFAPESKPLEGYTIKRAIYRGGFGEVYYAVTDAGREVALKLLQHNTDVELRGVQQCLNLSHPNLVTIFDIRQDGDGDHWIVMEYVAGETLDQAVRRFPSGMPMEEIRRWLPGISEGVSYLHENGLVHRDLKPANIFSDVGCVKVGDVGLSKFITQSRRSAQTQSVGTVYYMAPEVAKGRYGKEVDVYALGVILYEMLTGKVPFDGDSTGEILMKHLTEKPDLTRLPPRLRNVVGQSLEKDPVRRFDSPREFARAVDAAVVGRDYQPASGAGYSGGSCDPAFDGSPNQQFRRASRLSGKKKYCGMTPWPHEDGRDYGSAAFTWLCLMIFFGWMGIGVMMPISFMFVMFFGANWAYRKIGGIGRGVSGFVRSVSGDFSGSLINGFNDPRRLKRWNNAGRHVASAGQHVAGAAQAVKATVANAVFPASLKQSAAPALTRWTHWTGTAALSAILVLLTTFIATFATATLTSWSAFTMFTGNDPQSWSMFAAFTSSAIVACWGITATCKFWEGRSPWGLARRASLALVGLLVGSFSGAMTQFIAVDSRPVAPIATAAVNPRSPAGELARELSQAIPELNFSIVASALFFAAFFALRNWSRQSDESRPARFRLTSLFVSAFVAGAAGLFLFDSGFSPMLLAWAAIVSSSVQLASVWRPAPPMTNGRVA